MEGFPRLELWKFLSDFFRIVFALYFFNVLGQGRSLSEKTLDGFQMLFMFELGRFAHRGKGKRALGFLFKVWAAKISSWMRKVLSGFVLVSAGEEAGRMNAG